MGKKEPVEGIRAKQLIREKPSGLRLRCVVSQKRSLQKCLKKKSHRAATPRAKKTKKFCASRNTTESN